MNKKDEISVIPDETVISKIYLLREEKVMIDSDLADLYGVETRRLNEQVRRNIDRFPEDFMFRLTKAEFDNLKSQFATSSWGGRRK
jgi:ORF6N domain